MDFDLALPSGRIRARRWGPPDAPLLLCVPGLSANLTANPLDSVTTVTVQIVTLLVGEEAQTWLEMEDLKFQVPA